MTGLVPLARRFCSDVTFQSIPDILLCVFSSSYASVVPHQHAHFKLLVGQEFLFLII